MAKQRSFRPWRFSLATLLLLFTLFAIFFGYVSQRRSWNARRREAIRVLLEERATIVLANGDHLFDKDSSDGQGWRHFLFNDIEPIRTIHIGYGSGAWGSEYSPINDAALSLLPLLTEVEEVEIRGATEVTDNSLRLLAGLPNLKSFTADKLPNVTGSFLREWDRCDHLESLSLTRLSALKGENLTVLSRLARLQSLTMRSCSSVTFASLQKVDLPSTLTSLTIGEYYLGGPALAETTSTKDVSIGDATVRRWLEQTHLTHLSLDIPFSRAIAPFLARQTSLESLQLINKPLLVFDLDFLGACPNLTRLYLVSHPADGRFLKAFPKSTQLAYLTLYCMPIIDEHLAIVGQFQNLKYLNLSQTTVDGGFLSDSPPPKLNELLLMGTRFSEKGKQSLIALKGITVVSYPSNWTIQDFARYKPGSEPKEITISDFHDDDMNPTSLTLNSFYPPDFEFPPLDRCPPDLMAPLLQLRDLGRAEGLELKKRQEAAKKETSDQTP